MKRHDWAARLFDVIDTHRDRAFVWGRHDCGLFASRCYDAMHGTDIEGALISEYGDEGGAARFLAGFGGLHDAVVSRLGSPSQGRAVRGDVVLVDGEGGDALGICVGARVACLTTDGLCYVGRKHIKAFWRG
jgi:hypothetical protein